MDVSYPVSRTNDHGMAGTRTPESELRSQHVGARPASAHALPTRRPRTPPLRPATALALVGLLVLIIAAAVVQLVRAS